MLKSFSMNIVFVAILALSTFGCTSTGSTGSSGSTGDDSYYFIPTATGSEINNGY